MIIPFSEGPEQKPEPTRAALPTVEALPTADIVGGDGQRLDPPMAAYGKLRRAHRDGQIGRRCRPVPSADFNRELGYVCKGAAPGRPIAGRHMCLFGLF